MKKYTSGSFTATKYAIYKEDTDTITSFPASIIANGGNITPWTVYGNTVEGVSVGEKTANLFDGALLNGYFTNNSFDLGGPTTLYKSIKVNLSAGTYSLSASKPFKIIRTVFDDVWAVRNINVTTFYEFSVTTDDYVGISLQNIESDTPWDDTTIIMLNTGSTALPYEPFGYKLTVVIGSNTTNIYMADVLRKSSGADPVYDIMSSTGIITRNVDTDGTPLLTPTTESFTAPTLATVAGSQSVSFDTTVKPSKAELTYTGWHTHSDKKRSGGAWT